MDSAAVDQDTMAAWPKNARGPPEGGPLVGRQPRLGLGVGELGNNAKLLHHPERVPVRVLLDDLAVRKA